MKTYVIILALFSAPAAIGPIIDRLLLARQKAFIQVKLIDWWCRVERWKAPELFKVCTDITIRNLKAVLSPRNYIVCSFYVYGLVASLCILFTSTETYNQPLNYGYFAIRDGEFSYLFGGREWATIYSYGITFLINVPFDIASLLLTYIVLKRICRKQSLSKKVSYLSLDIFLSLILAVGVAISMIYISDNGNWPKEGWLSFSEKSGFYLEHPMHAYVINENWPPEDYFAFMVPFTTFGASLLIYLTLSFLVVSQVVLTVFKQIFMWYFERASEENDPKQLIPFTLAGCVCSVFAIPFGILLKALV